MFKLWLPSIIAITVAVLVLLGTFFPNNPILSTLRPILIEGATIIGAFALFLASFHYVVGVHLARLGGKNKHKLTSVLIVLSAIVSAVLVLIPPGPDGLLAQTWMNAVLIPGETALLALTSIVMIVAGMRILRVRRNLGSVIFVLVVIAVLVSTVLPSALPLSLVKGFDSIVMRFIDTAALAGMRGLILGVALGITLAGIRILFWVDRPYSDE